MYRSYETYWGIIWDYNDCFDTIDDNRRRDLREGLTRCSAQMHCNWRAAPQIGAS